MVYVDVPGLSRDLNVKYRPPRISLFPPSYRDRAYLRSIHRDVLRQTQGMVKIPEDDKTKVGKNVRFQLESGRKTDQNAKSSQTLESHCYHECSYHPREQNKENGKKGNKQQDSQDISGKDKSSNDKGGKDNKKEDSAFKIPDSLKSFLPYPFTSSSADLFWGNTKFQKPFPEKPFVNKEDGTGWNLEYKLEAARRADEKYMWSWMSEQEGNCQKGAFEWLAVRDVERQAKLAQASQGLASLSMDSGVSRKPPALITGLHANQVGNYYTPGNNAYYGGAVGHGPNCPCCSTSFKTTSLQACVDEFGNIRLGDGTIVAVNGYCASSQPQQGLHNVYRPPLAPLYQRHTTQQPAQPQNHQQFYNPGPTIHYPLQFSGVQPQQGQQAQYHSGHSNMPGQYTQPWESDPNPASGGWSGPNNKLYTYNSGVVQGNNAWKNRPSRSATPWGSGGNNAGLQTVNNQIDTHEAPVDHDINRNNDPWGQPSGNDNSGAETVNWGGGNDENNKPHDFFAGTANNNQMDSPPQEQNNDNTSNNLATGDVASHPFFASATAAAPANSPKPSPKMSGAKGRGRREYPPDSW